MDVDVEGGAAVESGKKYIIPSWNPLSLSPEGEKGLSSAVSYNIRETEGGAR